MQQVCIGVRSRVLNCIRLTNSTTKPTFRAQNLINSYIDEPSDRELDVIADFLTDIKDVDVSTSNKDNQCRKSRAEAMFCNGDCVFDVETNKQDIRDYCKDWRSWGKRRDHAMAQGRFVHAG